MNIHQPERSDDGAPSNTLDDSHDQRVATTRLGLPSTHRIRRVGRQLALATCTVVIAVAATGCSSSGEREADDDTTIEPSPPRTTDDDDLVDDDQEDHGTDDTDDLDGTDDTDDLDGTDGTDGQQPEQDEQPPLTPTPQELVGTWHNDPDGIDWYLTFTADGTYALYSADLDVYDEGYVDTSDGRLHLVTATGDTRPAQLVVPAEGCDWKVDAWELYGYPMTQLQLCDRAAWVMG